MIKLYTKNSGQYHNCTCVTGSVLESYGHISEVKKTEIMASGICHADYMAPSIRKSSH
jgi:hypothetical protein